MRRGGGSALPDDGHRIFKECHSEERSDVGIRFLLCGSAARGEYGLPRAFHALAMTGFGGAGRSRRRGEGTPPYGGTYKVCVGAAAPPDDGHRIFINCHSEERSDVGIRFLLCGSAARGEYGLPRAFHALAMTGFGGAGRSRRRGDVGIVLRIGGGRRTAGQFTLFSYFFLLQNL